MSVGLQREASNDEGEANSAEAVALEEGHEVAEADEHHDRHADVRVVEGDVEVVPVLGLWGGCESDGEKNRATFLATVAESREALGRPYRQCMGWRSPQPPGLRRTQEVRAQE